MFSQVREANLPFLFIYLALCRLQYDSAKCYIIKSFYISLKRVTVILRSIHHLLLGVPIVK